MKLTGKTALVSGAGRGLGRATALALAREGADLVIASRTPQELEETAIMIIAQGRTVVSQVADVGKPAEVSRLVTTALETFGTVDILVNNAAVLGPVKPLHTVSDEEWDQAMAIDLRGAWLLAREVAFPMIRQRSGKIINVTSGLAEFVMSPFGAYSIGKAGLNHLTRIMAEELRPYNIQVNGLDPAVMDTRMQAEIRGFGPAVLGVDIYAEFRAMKEEGRLLPPESVADLAVFLASAEADGISGEIGTKNHFRRFGYHGE